MRELPEDELLEQVLDAFVASRVNAGGADLSTWIAQFPQYERELMRCAASWGLVQSLAMDPDPNGVTDDDLVTHGINIVGSLLKGRGTTSDREVQQPLRVPAPADPVASEAGMPDRRADELHRVREQLLYSVAHEVRGPLTVLDNALELLSTSFGELSVDECINLVNQARRTTGRLRNLMDDLLNAGTIESGQFVVTPEPTPLAQLINDALELVLPSLEARRQHVDVTLPEEAKWVQADPRYTRQVLSNLVANASKYAPEGSSIRIAARRSAGTVTVEVADEGRGIAQEHLPHVFERFYRIRVGSEEPGMGLGLAIARSIIAAHGCQIGIDSKLGAGTTAWFTLPEAGQQHADSPGR